MGEAKPINPIANDRTLHTYHNTLSLALSINEEIRSRVTYSVSPDTRKMTVERPR